MDKTLTSPSGWWIVENEAYIGKKDADRLGDVEACLPLPDWDRGQRTSSTLNALGDMRLSWSHTMMAQPL